MLRSSLYTAGALLVCTSAFAQQEARSRPTPITAPVREVTVNYDHATKHAVRTFSPINAGTIDPVYNNTCNTGYYRGATSGATTGGSQSQAVVDQGRVPSTGSAQTATCTTGLADTYNISQFQIGYCTTTGAPVDYIANFWDAPQGTACPNLFGSASTVAITVVGLPRSGAAGTLACYLVTINLGTPGFTLTGGTVAADRFAWSHQYPGTTGTDGPIIAGNPNFGGCAPCAGTLWERPTPTTNPGTGLGATDSFYLETFGGTGAGCFFFGGNPFASFHLRLDAFKAGASSEPGTPFCDAGDGATALCPCGPTINPTGGCNIAQGAGVQLTVLSQVTGPNAATLQGSGYPPAATPTAIVIRGNNQEPTPVLFGDGLRCVGTVGFARLAGTNASAGVSTHTIGHTAAAGVYRYQIWFRNTPASYCVTTGTAAGAFNLTNGRALTW